MKNSYDRNHPFMATIKERYPLCREGSQKNTQHIVLDIAGSGIEYQVGDSIAVFPTNDPGLVQRTLDAMGGNGEEAIYDKRSEQTLPLRDFLTQKANITEISRRLVKELCQRQTQAAKKEQLEALFAADTSEPLKEYQAHRELWDALQEHSEVRFDFQELCDMLMPILPRFYSIASSMVEVGDEVHLTVALVTYDAGGAPRTGVCTNYLCHLAPVGSPAVPIYIQPHKGFTLPEDHQVPIVMIGPGTGIAPFRGFMQERVRRNGHQNWLFFGEWHREFDFFYEDYWLSLEEEGKLRLDAVFSRDQEYKVYVQHQMLKHGADLFDWIQKGAHLFVCGDAREMAKDVDHALHQIVAEHGKMDPDNAKQFIKKLRQEKRYLRDVY